MTQRGNVTIRVFTGPGAGGGNGQLYEGVDAALVNGDLLISRGDVPVAWYPAGSAALVDFLPRRPEG